MATTPPLQPALHTPPTPLHGASQRAVQTPPPQSSKLSLHSELQSKLSKASGTRSAAHTYSPPSSTQTSPQKKLFNTGRTKDAKSGAAKGSSLDSALSKNMDGSSISQERTSIMGASMLPTPAKTPRKKHSQAANGIGRVLFSVRPDTVEEAMPIPRKNKRNRRHVGFSLDSEAESEGGIQIFTDSQDKIPELDLSEANPFIDHPMKRDPPETSSKAKVSNKRKPQSESVSKETIKEAFDHERGMVYVFRGRKIYKPFPRESPSSGENPITSTTHFTRSSVKPRLLFPTAQQQRERQLADEEAITDIEASHDSDMTDVATEETETEEQGGTHVVTPVKTSFTPATPPTTVHATRAATKKGVEASPLDAVPVEVKKKGGKRSPFDGWARRKAGTSATATGKGRKRQGEALEKGDDDSDGGVPINGSVNKKVKANTAGS
ncbi:MAG: hypothetical protein Q9195_004411 [Heterodermia aff. obscurata]